MEELFANIAAGLKAADSFLWGPPLLILLLGTHLFYTVRLRFIQSHLGTAFKLVAKQDGQLSGNVAPFAALAVALASTIGTGNVVGVATAIALGGPQRKLSAAFKPAAILAKSSSIFLFPQQKQSRKGKLHSGLR